MKKLFYFLICLFFSKLIYADVCPDPKDVAGKYKGETVNGVWKVTYRCSLEQIACARSNADMFFGATIDRANDHNKNYYRPMVECNYGDIDRGGRKGLTHGLSQFKQFKPKGNWQADYWQFTCYTDKGPGDCPFEPSSDNGYISAPH